MTDSQRVLASITAIQVPVGHDWLNGDLAVPPGPVGTILFAHGSGSSRRSPRNQFVARTLQGRGFATLLADLLTSEEELIDLRTAQMRFDIALLGERLIALVDHIRHRPDLGSLPVGLFGASTGAAAALVAAAARPGDVGAVVSRGGRPDLAGTALPRVVAPTLLLVGSLDYPVIGMNREAKARMSGLVELTIVPGATHLFEEPGTLEQVARHAGEWFEKHLQPKDSPGAIDARLGSATS